MRLENRDQQNPVIPADAGIQSKKESPEAMHNFTGSRIKPALDSDRGSGMTHNSNANLIGTRFPRYSKLLLLYPKSYRESYGEQMLQTLADMLDGAETRKERTLVWIRLAFDFPLSLTAQNVQYLGGIMTHETPKYVWRNGLIGGIMLLPFFAALTANLVDQLVNHQALYSSWLWGMPALAIWVIWLPLGAAVLGLISLLAFLRHQTKAKHESSLNALIDIRYNWPLLAVALLGSFILVFVFFHDSVRCLTGNPIREAHNPSATWHCIERR